MAFNQGITATSLTPSRPAPQVPRRDADNTPMYTQNVALASSGYNASFSLTPSSPSGSSYAASYSGIGGSPNRNSEAVFSAQIVRNGTVSIKEDGFASWLWRPKWLVLKEQTLSIHKTEVSIRSSFCGLADLQICGPCLWANRCCTASFHELSPELDVVFGGEHRLTVPSTDYTTTKRCLPSRYSKH